MFSMEACRLMICMLDRDFSGKMGFNEFKELWGALNQWKVLYFYCFILKHMIFFSVIRLMNFILFRISKNYSIFINCNFCDLLFWNLFKHILSHWIFYFKSLFFILDYFYDIWSWSIWNYWSFWITSSHCSMG